MNLELTKEEIKKLFRESRVVTGFFDGTNFISDNNEYFSSQQLIVLNNNFGKAFILKYQDKYLCIVGNNNSLLNVDILKDLRRRKKISNNIRYLVKTISLNTKNNEVWLGGYRKDKLVLLKTDFESIPSDNLYVTNLGRKDKFNINIQRPSSSLDTGSFYINNLNKKEEDFFSTDKSFVEKYLGNGLYESENTQNRLTIIDDKIFSNNVDYDFSESPNGDECRQPIQGEDEKVTVKTWTPKNPSSPFVIERKNCGLTFEDDPTLEERNPVGAITYTFEEKFIGYDFGTTNSPEFADFKTPADDQGVVVGGERLVGSANTGFYSLVSYIEGIISGSVKTFSDDENGSIEVEYEVTYTANERVYKHTYTEVENDIAKNTSWDLVYSGELRRNVGERIDSEYGFTQEYSINKFSSNPTSVVTTQDNGQSTTRTEYPGNITYAQYFIDSFGRENYRTKRYSDFINGDFGLFNLNSRSEKPESGDLSIDYESSEALGDDQLPYVLEFQTVFQPIPREDVYLNETFEFKEFELDDPCALKGDVETETVCENYGGTFLAQRTSDGYIYQTISGNKQTRYFYNSDYTGENPQILQDSSSNSLRLEYPGKIINLDISKFFIGNIINFSNFNLESTFLQISSFGFTASSETVSTSFLLNKDYVANINYENNFYILKGKILSANNSAFPEIVISLSIDSIEKNKTSFQNKILINNDSFFNYFLRNKSFNFIFSDEDISKFIFNPFVNGLASLDFIETSSLHNFDNIVKNKIYVVVEIIKDEATIEEWIIQDNGKVSFNKIFKTPYLPLNKDSIVESHSYHP